MSFPGSNIVDDVRTQTQIALNVANVLADGWSNTFQKRSGDDGLYDPLREFHATVMRAYAKLTVDLGQVMADQQKPQA